MPIAEIAGITSTAKNAVDMLDRLDVLEKVKNKLFNNPDRAAKHLVRVLSEIEVVYRELERQILILSTLEFEPARELRKSRTYLRRLKNQGLRKQISDARNSCGQIKNIHRRYLTGWFNRALSKREVQSLNSLFDHMSILDDSLVGVMWGLSDGLRAAAEQILTAVDRTIPRQRSSISCRSPKPRSQCRRTWLRSQRSDLVAAFAKWTGQQASFERVPLHVGGPH